MTEPIIHGIINSANVKVYYTEYKLTPADKNKGLKQIAREQLHDESLYASILRWHDKPLPNGHHDEEISNKNSIGGDWTLLLPPTDFSTFILSDLMNVRSTHKVESNNLLYVADKNTNFIYKKSTIFSENGLVWVDVAKTEHHKDNKVHANAWICVKEGTIHHTVPTIDMPAK